MFNGGFQLCKLDLTRNMLPIDASLYTSRYSQLKEEYVQDLEGRKEAIAIISAGCCGCDKQSSKSQRKRSNTDHTFPYSTFAVVFC